MLNQLIASYRGDLQCSRRVSHRYRINLDLGECESARGARTQPGLHCQSARGACTHTVTQPGLLLTRPRATLQTCRSAPDGPCPLKKNDKTVKLCQGDLMLCKACDEARFPRLSKNKPSPSKAAKAAKDKSRTQKGAASVNSSTSEQVNGPCGGACEHESCLASRPQHAGGAGAGSQSDKNNAKDNVQRDSSATGTGPTDPVINEVLCFMCNKIDSLPYDILVKLVADTYSEDEVEKAKELLFARCVTGTDGPRHIRRRGMHKKNNDLQDMMNILMDIESHLMPVFVAKDLSKLPPLTSHHFDIASFNKDFADIKAEMAMMKLLVVDELRQIRLASSLPATSHDTPTSTTEATRDTAIAETVTVTSDSISFQTYVPPSQSAKDLDSAATSEQDHSESTAMDFLVTEAADNSGSTATDNSLEPDSRLDSTEKVDPAQPHKYRSEGELSDTESEQSVRMVESMVRSRAARVRERNQTRYSEVVRRDRPFNTNRQSHIVSTDRDGYHRLGSRREKPQQRQSGDPVVTGTGRFSTLQAAPQLRNNDTQNRDPPGVFVSRLHKDTSAGTLATHIWLQTGLRAKCISLKSRRDDCMTFRVIVPDCHVNRLLDNDVWPSRTIVRRYRERATVTSR